LRLRELLTGTALSDLLRALADLQPARYSSIIRVASGLGRAEQEMGARLEFLLYAYRDAALAAVAGDQTRPVPVGSVAAADAPAAVRRADAVAGALRTLRRRNPNRPLLAEALALRLARS
jgi:hypothetical protein